MSTSNPQCNSTTQIFWNGTSFNTATAFFKDIALTLPASDGWYAFGLVVRQILNGVLLAPVPCDACVIPCGDPFIFSGGYTGSYTIKFDMAAPNPGAGIITFSSGIDRDTFFPVPDQCEWQYNNQTSTEYSTMQAGYIRGLMGAPDVIGSTNNCLRYQTPLGNTYALSSNLGTQGTAVWGEPFSYDISSNLFLPPAINPIPIPTAPPYVELANAVGTLGWTGIINNGGSSNKYPSTLLSWNCSDKKTFMCGNINNALGVPDSPYNSNLPIAPNLQNWSSLGTTKWPSVGITYKNGVMVVPAPFGVSSTIMTITISAPCASTWWAIDVKCPEPLTGILSSTEFGDLEYDQSPGGQASKTPLETTLKGSGITSCGFVAQCASGFLICETAGVDFNDPTQFPPNGIQAGDLVKDPVTGYFANITYVAPIGNQLTIVNANAAQDAVTAFANTAKAFEVYTKGVCEYDINRFIYHVPVDAWGNSNPNSFYDAGEDFPSSSPSGQPKGVLGLGDWVFSDIAGSNPLPVGVYLMTFDALDGNGLQKWAVQVGPREYFNTSTYSTGFPVDPGVSNGAFTSADPPEDYIGQTQLPDHPNPLTFTEVQRNGPRKAGIVRSITPCVPPESFDCISPIGSCIDPGNGLGTYSTLVDCQNGTSTLPACAPDVTYDCISGVCVDPGTGLGTYTGANASAALTNCLNGTATDPACSPITPCGQLVTVANGGVGKYEIDTSVGSATGAVIVRFNPFNWPDRCVWTYDGVSASEYSSPNVGYMQGLIGMEFAGSDPTVCSPVITNAAGSAGQTYSGAKYLWNSSTQSFQVAGSAVLGPYTNQAAGGVTLLPNAIPTLVNCVIEGPCAGGGFGGSGTSWDVTIACPVKLSTKERGPLNGTCGYYDYPFYTASPHTTDGLSPNNLEVHDWVFEDADGVTPLAAGLYPARYPGGPNKIMTVSVEGIIISLIDC